MDPMNGDAELTEEASVLHEDEDASRSASYWEEVDQEEIERARRYSEFIRFNYYSVPPNHREFYKLIPVMFTY